MLPENVKQEIKLFENPEFGRVRVFMRDGEPWFVAKDICDILELDNVSWAIESLDADEKSVLSSITTCDIASDFNGLRSSMRIVNESGLYALIFKSRKPEAKKFRKWVTSEVLPSIRQTGNYYGGYRLPRVPQSFSDALRMIADVEEQKEKAIAERDYAIRTKAEIGSRREATAMNTASIAVRQRDKYADELGYGKTWKEVKAIPWLLEIFGNSKGMYSQVGKKLGALSLELGYDVRRKETDEYPNGIGIYHVDVIEEFYNRLMANEDMLGKYRKV